MGGAETFRHSCREAGHNARQGFWNGSHPPFGYRVETKERRGNKDKRVLVVDDAEASVVRLIFALAAGEQGRPSGIKAIASYMNERGITRRGKKFATDGVHDLLSDTTYHGTHYFNRRDSRSGKPPPPSQWIAIETPAIVAEERFNAVRALMQSRNPKRMPPRVANGPTLLAGLFRCGYCRAL